MSTSPPFDQILAAAYVAHDKFFPLGPFVSISLAQGDLESANFTQPSGKNNYFGIKATKSQIAAGKATLRGTHETRKGVYGAEDDYFADYDSLEDAFIAHATLLATSRYYIKAQHAATPDDYARALQGIYATGIPGVRYDDTLIKIMKQKNYYQYDKLQKPVSASQEKTKMTDVPVETSINTSSATATSPPRVVPTSSQPVRIPWLHWAEQGLVHEQGAIETLANAGLGVAVSSVPFGSLILGAFGPTIVHEVVSQTISLVKNVDDSGVTDIIVPDNAIAKMVAKSISDVAPTFFVKAEGFLDEWIKSAIGSVKGA